MSEGRVDTIYQAVKDMAVSFALKPGDRLNEVALARDLGVSRTPLREALNRLVSEQLIEVRAGTGFFCRGLDAKSVSDLYELRQVLETAIVRSVCDRASDAEIARLRADHYDVSETLGATVGEATERDERFHTDLARLTGNSALVRELTSVNERIRFIRWIDMRHRVGTTKAEHRAIIDAIAARQPRRAAKLMAGHIESRRDHISASVREGISSIYLDGPESVFGRPIAET